MVGTNDGPRIVPSISHFWGKARSGFEGPGFHPLLAHCLDVAAVATQLPWCGAPLIDPRMVGCLVALHDIGKFSRPFQAKAPEYWPQESLGPLLPAPDMPHDQAGSSS